jgi:predicted TIM-barrel enzyme
MPRLERQAILAKLQAMKKAAQPIIGGGAGTGLSAKCEEAGGIDLLVIYNSCRYRMAGRGSLAGIVCHLGLTAGGTIGAHTGRKLEECPKLVDEWAGAALDVNPEAIILVHGGPVAEPQDAEFILRSTKRCHGFYGASSMERLPTERAMTDQTKRFKAVAFEKASL